MRESTHSVLLKGMRDFQDCINHPEGTEIYNCGPIKNSPEQPRTTDWMRDDTFWQWKT